MLMISLVVALAPSAAAEEHLRTQVAATAAAACLSGCTRSSLKGFNVTYSHAAPSPLPAHGKGATSLPTYLPFVVLRLLGVGNPLRAQLLTVRLHATHRRPRDFLCIENLCLQRTILFSSRAQFNFKAFLSSALESLSLPASASACTSPM